MGAFWAASTAPLEHRGCPQLQALWRWPYCNSAPALALYRAPAFCPLLLVRACSNAPLSCVFCMPCLHGDAKSPSAVPTCRGLLWLVTAPVLWHTCDVLATQHLLIVEGHGHHEGGRKGAAGLGALETATLHGMCGKAWHLRT